MIVIFVTQIYSRVAVFHTRTVPESSSSNPLGYRLPYASEAEEPSASSGFESDTTSDFTVDGVYQSASSRSTARRP